jgi:hypothetical protein
MKSAEFKNLNNHYLVRKNQQVDIITNYFNLLGLSCPGHLRYPNIIPLSMTTFTKWSRILNASGNALYIRVCL